jgi:hypothetical protein
VKPLPIALAALALAGCGTQGPDPAPPAATLPVLYQRGYGGYTGGTAELRIEADGRATLRGGPPGEGCTAKGARFTLASAEQSRLRTVLAAMPSVDPRQRLEPSVEAPEWRITAGPVELHYIGLDAPPQAARPIAFELERIVRNHCVRPVP